MTFWYLFVGATSQAYRDEWQIPQEVYKALPTIPQHSICFMNDIGVFDERDGDLGPGFQGWAVPGFTAKGPEYTVHFCAARKNVLHTLVQFGKYPDQPGMSPGQMVLLATSAVCIILAASCFMFLSLRRGQVRFAVIGMLLALLVCLGAHGTMSCSYNKICAKFLAPDVKRDYT